ncbi:hypothetical protein AWENTII_002867 [Aspergillus wentii]
MSGFPFIENFGEISWLFEDQDGFIFDFQGLSELMGQAQSYEPGPSSRNKRRRSDFDFDDEDETIWWHNQLSKRRRRSNRTSNMEQEGDKKFYAIDNIHFWGDVTIREAEEAADFAFDVHETSLFPGTNPKNYVFWVDGSGAGGAGVVYREPSKSSRWVEYGVQIPYGYSSGMAEVVAVAAGFQVAIDFVKTLESAGTRTVTIFTDSQGTLSMFKSFSESMESTPELLTALDYSRELQKMGVHVHLHWVPKRAKLPGHGMADKMARRAADFNRVRRGSLSDVVVSWGWMKRRAKENPLDLSEEQSITEPELLVVASNAFDHTLDYIEL